MNAQNFPSLDNYVTLDLEMDNSIPASLYLSLEQFLFLFVCSHLLPFLSNYFAILLMHNEKKNNF